MSVNGSYALEKNENLEPFLKSLGLKEEKVARMVAATPTLTIKLSGNTLEIISKTTDTVTNTLTIGGASTFSLASGFEIEITDFAMSGTTAKGTMKKGPHTGEFTIDVTEAGLVEVFNVGGTTCKRIYKRV